MKYELYYENVITWFLPPQSDPAHAKFKKTVLITWKDWKLYYPNRNLSCLETFRRVFKLMSLACTLIGWHIKASIWLVKKSNNQFEILDRKIGKMGKKKQSRNCFLAGVSIKWPFMTSFLWRHRNFVIWIQIIQIWGYSTVKSLIFTFETPSSPNRRNKPPPNLFCI